MVQVWVSAIEGAARGRTLSRIERDLEEDLAIRCSELVIQLADFVREAVPEFVLLRFGVRFRASRSREDRESRRACLVRKLLERELAPLGAPSETERSHLLDCRSSTVSTCCWWGTQSPRSVYLSWSQGV